MIAPSVITLLTDFGTRDYFVSSMKGVILGIHPEARVIDLSHEVAPQNISEAAFLLKSAYRYFPKSTIHMAIVDPEVGSGRRPLLAVSPGYFFIAPDNGVLSWIYDEESPIRVFHITSEEYFLKSPGQTFHARDLFSPVAAWLARGVEFTRFGPEIRDYKVIPVPRPVIEDGIRIRGRVLYIDRFGNLITNITRSDLEKIPGGRGSIVINFKDIRIPGLKSFYAEAKQGEPGALVNSCGHLEIFCYLKSAREGLKAFEGDELSVSRPE